MKFNKIILIILLTGLILSISAVSAENVNQTDDIVSVDNDLVQSNAVDEKLTSSSSGSIYVDGENGDDSNDGTSWDSSFKTFNKALDSANDDDTIFIANGSYTGEDNTGITISKSVNIVGSGNTVFDGEYLNYLFIVSDDVNVSFKNIAFINAYKSDLEMNLVDDFEMDGRYGSALDIQKATVLLDNCYFKDNILNYESGVEDFSYGGALSNFGDLTIVNSCFFRNSVGATVDIYGYGGSIYNKGKMLIDNTSFLSSGGSTYTYGGAIYNDGVLLMNNSIIANSYLWEESKGGAIFNNNNFTLLNSIIENNTIERTDFNYIYGNIFNSGHFMACGNIFRNNTGNYKQPNSAYYGSPTFYNTGSLDLSYNAFIDNVGFNGINTDMYIGGSTGLNIDNNWWGCNENPFNFDKINLNEVNSWIILDVDPAYSSLKSGESVNVVASWKLSNKQIPQINLLPVFNITFLTTVDGNEIFSQQTLANGEGNFTFNYTQNNGIYEIVIGVNSFSTKAIIEVGKSNSHIFFNSSTDRIYFNETVQIDIQLLDDDFAGISDRISVFLNGKKYDVDIVNGRGNITFSNLAPDEYLVRLVYDGSALYSKSENETSFVVDKIPINLTIDEVGDIKTSDIVNLTVRLEGWNVQGVGYLYINGKFKQQIYLNNGISYFNLSNFPQGEYNVTVILPENSYYEGSNYSVFFNVDMSRVSLNISCEDIIAGETAVIVIETSEDNFNSEALLYINEDVYTVFLAGRQNNITVSNLANGTYEIAVIFDGNERYTKANASSSFKVSKLLSSLDVIIEKNNLTGKITVKTNSTKCSGWIGLYVNNRYYAKNLRRGEAVFDVEFDKGTNYIYAFYDGDITFTPSNYSTSIGEGENFFIIGSDMTVWQNTDFNYTVQLFEENGMAVPNKNVTMEIAGRIYNITTDGKGIAVLPLNLDEGDYYVSVSYRNASIQNTIFVKPIIFKINTQNIAYLENETIEIVFENNITGKISIKVSDVLDAVLDITNTNSISYNLSSLNVGSYDVEAYYSRDGFKSQVIYSSFEVSKADMELNVIVSAFSVGSTGNITVIIPHNAKGDITFVVDGKSRVKTIDSSEIVLTLSNLDAGLHTLSVIYSGDESFNNASYECNFSVRDLTTSLILTIDDGDYSSEFKITAKVNETATGYVTFKVANLSNVSPINDGVATWTFTGLDAGSYTIFAFYSGDYSFNNATETANFKVNKAQSSIELYVNGAYLDENIRIYARVSPNATGMVTFSMVDYYSPRNRTISNSIASWLISPLDTGSYIVNAMYCGDNNYYSSSTQFILNMTQHKSNLKVEINDAGKNDNVVITAKLTYGDARPIGGIVYVNIGSKSYRIVVIEGTGSLNIGKMDVDVYEFRATYGGSEEYGKSECDGSFRVLDTLLNVVLTSNNVTKYYGGKDKLVITLETPSGRAISGATLHVTINKNKKDYVTDSNGQVLVDLNYGVGTYDVKVEFDETKSYHAASTTSVVNVLSTVEASDLVKLAGSGSQYFAIFHDSNGKALANTNVKFSIAGKTYTFKTLPNGIARININLAPGKYVITAINTVTGQQVKNNIKIYNKIMENNDLTMFYTSGKYYKVRAFGSDGNPVGAGKTVKITISGKTYSVKTDKNGYASIQINLKPNTYTVTASYDGYNVSNKIVVKPILITSNLAYKKATSYKYYAKVLDSNGKILVNKVVSFKFNGKTYTAKTSQYGYAIIYLKVNLNPGKYSITTSYGKSTNTNTITITK